MNARITSAAADAARPARTPADRQAQNWLACCPDFLPEFLYATLAVPSQPELASAAAETVRLTWDSDRQCWRGATKFRGSEITIYLLCHDAGRGCNGLSIAMTVSCGPVFREFSGRLWSAYACTCRCVLFGTSLALQGEQGLRNLVSCTITE